MCHPPHAGLDRPGVSIADADGNALAVNDELCEIFGRSSEEMLAPGTFDHLVADPDDLARDKSLLREVFAGERDGYQLTKRYERSDGTPLPGVVDVMVVRDEGGRPDAAVGVVVIECKHHSLSDASAETLRLLFDRKRRAEEASEAATAQLVAAVLRATEEGASRREIAAALGVGSSTVQGWITRNRER